jgi:hypothetical protein
VRQVNPRWLSCAVAAMSHGRQALNDGLVWITFGGEGSVRGISKS